MTSLVRGKVDVPPTEGNYADELLAQIWQHSIANPNRPAFINGEDTSESITFKELYTCSMSVSAFLQQRGFRKGDLAAFITPNCWQVSTIFMGVIQIGGVLTAANSDCTSYELERQLKDSQCRVVFCSESALEKIVQASQTAKSIEVIVVIDQKSSIQRQCPYGVYTYSQVRQTHPVLIQPKPVIDAEKDLIMLPYSSGTTGPPKGVMLSHQNLGTSMNTFIGSLKSEMLPFIGADYNPANEKSLLFLPFYHLFGLCNSLSSLWLGYTGIILSRFNPQLFCQHVQDNKIRYLACVPPIAVILANSPLVDQYDLHSLKCLMSGAAPIGKEICDKIKKRLSVKFIGQAYGMTEIRSLNIFI